MNFLKGCLISSLPEKDRAAAEEGTEISGGDVHQSVASDALGCHLTL